MRAARCWKGPKPGSPPRKFATATSSPATWFTGLSRAGFSPAARFGCRNAAALRLEQFVIFNQQFLTLVRAGLPIVQALELLAKRQRNQYFKMLLEDVRDRTKGGELISDAFEKQGAFPKIYSTTLMAGEKSGNLDEVLSRYVAFQRLALSFRKKLISSLVYPVILVVGVLGLITMLVTFVIPKFSELFSDLGQKLPAMTEFTITTALTAKKYLPFIVLALVAIFLVLRRWSKTQQGAEMLDKIKLNMPVVGSIWQRYQIAVFSRMMSTLLSGGLPLVTALETAGQSMSSRLIVRGITEASKSVREGRSLAHSLEADRGVPGPCRGDGGGGRSNGRTADHAEFGCGVLRRRRSVGAVGGNVAD